MDEDSDETNNNNVENEAGVQQVSEVADNDEITTPPDNVIAKKMQTIDLNKCKSKASTSSSNIKASRVHIQDPRAKLNMSLLSLIQKEQECENPAEDEIDLAFASIANLYVHTHE